MNDVINGRLYLVRIKGAEDGDVVQGRRFIDPPDPVRFLVSWVLFDPDRTSMTGPARHGPMLVPDQTVEVLEGPLD